MKRGTRARKAVAPEDPEGLLAGENSAPGGAALPGAPAPVVAAVRDGEWIDPEQLRQSLLTALQPAEGGRPPAALSLDLGGIDFLETPVLQVLLAADAELRRRGGGVRLAHPSPRLRDWFELAGSGALLEPAPGSH